jgi:MFS family permease
MGYSTQSVILLYLVFNVIYTLAAFPAGVLSDRIGRRTLLVAGYIFYGLVYLGFALVSKGQFLWLLFGVYGLYSALTEGVEKALLVVVFL